MIRLWKLGSLEHKILPTYAAIQKLREILSQSNSLEFVDIVWGPDIEVTELKTGETISEYVVKNIRLEGDKAFIEAQKV